MHWPAAFTRHKATYIAWPIRREIWPDFEAAEKTYAKIINILSEQEPVKLLLGSKLCEQKARKWCSNAIEFIQTKLDDSWVRDTLPTTLIKNNECYSVMWHFNAWGEKFKPYDQDAALKHHFYQGKKIETFLTLEEGGIHTNGEGLILTTKSCLFNKNRNPNKKSEQQILDELKRVLNAESIICLNTGLKTDLDTDGHIDNLACFIDTNKILIHEDENFIENKALFKNFEIFSLPLPSPQYFTHRQEKKQFALSYINFYQGNEAIIMPAFKNEREDDYAREYIQSLFKKPVIQIQTLALNTGGGGIHCITKEEF